MYCTSNSTNEIDEEPLPMKKKKKSMSFSSSQNSLHGGSSSSSEKKQRKFCPFESKSIFPLITLKSMAMKRKDVYKKLELMDFSKRWRMRTRVQKKN